ncbi:MAG: hypothetical protein AABY22_01280 [Nanoarchaeota archaeon]
MSTTWQDIVITVCQLLFMVSVIPMITGPHKPPFISCLMTCILLIILLITFMTMNLLFVTLLTVVETVIWFIILFQVWRRDNGRSKSNKRFT